MKFPPAFWAWAKWRDGGKKGPRPNVPARIPVAWHVRYLVHRGPTPESQAKPSMFSELGGFVSQAGSFPPDTESARSFVKAGGKWLAVQFGDPTTDQGNRARFMEGWAERWRLQGVKVGAWWRVEHVGIPVPKVPPIDFLIPNPESQAELDRLPGILAECRVKDPSGPLAVITLGKIPGFPTGLLESLDAHLIPECFLETPQSDTSVTNSVKYWRDSQVPLARIHPCLLFKTGYATPVVDQAREAEALSIYFAVPSLGLSSFTAENTPATAWSVMA